MSKIYDLYLGSHLFDLFLLAKIPKRSLRQTLKRLLPERRILLTLFNIREITKSFAPLGQSSCHLVNLPVEIAARIVLYALSLGQRKIRSISGLSDIASGAVAKIRTPFDSDPVQVLPHWGQLPSGYDAISSGVSTALLQEAQ